MRIPLTATGRFCFGFEAFPTLVILCRFALEVLHFSPAMRQQFIGYVNTIDLAITKVTGDVSLARRKLVRRGKCDFLANSERTQEVACLICPQLERARCQ